MLQTETRGPWRSRPADVCTCAPGAPGGERVHRRERLTPCPWASAESTQEVRSIPPAAGRLPRTYPALCRLADGVRHAMEARQGSGRRRASRTDPGGDCDPRKTRGRKERGSCRAVIG